MEAPRKRYRAFISYSQRDEAIARRVHRALETYRLPRGVDAPVGPQRTLGRFFRDDDEIGASWSLGAALEGALDDSENLIVICSPSAARSKWVDAEVRHFKARGDGRVFAVIAAGEPHAAEPNRECFAPALKVKVDSAGELTEEPDEPRAPDLRDGIRRVRVELAAGLLDLPFDELWQRDRRRERRRRIVAGASALSVLGVLTVVGLGWLREQRESRIQEAHQAVAIARSAAADGRIGFALARLEPFLEQRDTRDVVEEPLRALLGWIPDPGERLGNSGIQPVRLRDAALLLDPMRGLDDISDIGLELGRMIRSRDGRRLIVIGDQRGLVLNAATGQRLAQLDIREVHWLGHAFEAPSGLIVVTGAVLGPTNGSVVPEVLAVSSDGGTVQRTSLRAHMFWGSAVGVTAGCDSLLIAVEDSPGEWQVESRALGAMGLSDATVLAPFRPAAESDPAPSEVLAASGTGFQTSSAFLAEAEHNPFTAAGCPAPGLDEGMVPGQLELQGVQAVSLDLPLTFEAADRWTPAEVGVGGATQGGRYLPDCTEARPCPVIGDSEGSGYVRADRSSLLTGHVGPPPAPRWARRTELRRAGVDSIFLEHLLFNSGHELTVCRPRGNEDLCLYEVVMGEDQQELPFLRSPDGRYLFWPFGGAVFDLQTLKPLTAIRTIPETPGMHFDFEVDRPGLTLAIDGRLVSFVPRSEGGGWARTDSERASPRFGMLTVGPGESPLHSLASLGNREYLAVRGDGTVARLDATSGEEVWRINLIGLGELGGVQLNQERRHALFMGSNAWRLIRLTDGLPLSALLAPPPMLTQPSDAAGCRLADALGPGGEVLAECGAGAFAWRPRMYGGELASRLARLTCTANVEVSAVELVRRCYFDH